MCVQPLEFRSSFTELRTFEYSPGSVCLDVPPDHGPMAAPIGAVHHVPEMVFDGEVRDGSAWLEHWPGILAGLAQ